MSSVKSQMTTKECNYYSDSDLTGDSEDEDFLNDLTHLNGATDCLNSGTNSGKKANNLTKKEKLGPKLVFCSLCQPIRYFKKQKVLDSHNEAIHPKAQTVYTCVECQKQFTTDHQKLIHQTLYRHSDH